MKRFRSIWAEAGWHGTGIVPDGGIRCKAARTGFAIEHRQVMIGQPNPPGAGSTA